MRIEILPNRMIRTDTQEVRSQDIQLCFRSRQTAKSMRHNPALYLSHFSSSSLALRYRVLMQLLSLAVEGYGELCSSLAVSL
jgi:hypothetical protein